MCADRLLTVNRLAFVAVGAVAGVIAGCGSSETKTVIVTQSTTAVSTATTSTPATTESSTTTSAPPRVHLATFKSPTGNIGCDIIAGTARCDISQRSWSPPPTPKSCPPVVDYGQGLVVGGSGPGRLVCAGDTTRDPSAAPLSYGTDTVVGSFQCTSRTTGMTCTNTGTGHGFFISFQGYRAF
jgi:uncharacterized protein DUF6636